MPEHMELVHLQREVKTALELAVVDLAPAPLVDRLALAAGLLEAISELPTDAAPVVALVPRTVGRAREALKEWQHWLDKHPPRGRA
jgi:hypothetical protein